MYAFLLACAITFCVILLALAAFEVIADRWADYEAGAREQLTMADIKALPESTAFDPKPDLVRARLRSVPTRPSLTVVPPVADDDWVFDENPFRIPSQRDGSGY